jgi:hypothetical protein
LSNFGKPDHSHLVELTRIELATSSLRTMRSTK